MSTKINPNAIAEGSISIDKIENLSTRLENIESSAGGANVQAVDTNDVVDDVNVDYITKTYFDSVVGDINCVLESIINGVVIINIVLNSSGSYSFNTEQNKKINDYLLQFGYDSFLTNPSPTGFYLTFKDENNDSYSIETVTVNKGSNTYDIIMTDNNHTFEVGVYYSVTIGTVPEFYFVLNK